MNIKFTCTNVTVNVIYKKKNKFKTSKNLPGNEYQFL